MTPTDDAAAAEAADVLQADYFRRSLCKERAQVVAEIQKRRANIAERTVAEVHVQCIVSGHTYDTPRLKCDI